MYLNILRIEKIKMIEDLDDLINEIKKLKLADEKQIVLELENLKSNKENAKSVLANLLTRFSEVATISSFVIEIFKKFS